MTERIDTLRTANLLIENYGEQASEVARERLCDMLALDDVKGAVVWLDVMSDIETLMNRNGATLH